MTGFNLVFLVSFHDPNEGHFVEFLANKGEAAARVLALIEAYVVDVSTWGDDGALIASAFVGKSKPETLAALNAVASGEIGRGIEWKPEPDARLEAKARRLIAAREKRDREALEDRLASEGVTSDPDGTVVLPNTKPTFKPSEE